MTSYENSPIEIVEGFLVLETNNGKLNLPPVDTVEDLYKKYLNIDYKNIIIFDQ